MAALLAAAREGGAAVLLGLERVGRATGPDAAAGKAAGGPGEGEAENPADIALGDEAFARTVVALAEAALSAATAAGLAPADLVLDLGCLDPGSPGAWNRALGAIARVSEILPGASILASLPKDAPKARLEEAAGVGLDMVALRDTDSLADGRPGGAEAAPRLGGAPRA
jgi:hypothetical protein